ncbi:hypothetical protein OIU79_026537 [Salix purpurea]|uniref:Uncharacterized protein n=1 Tax=Salix purpurea TaxID=77065 RepID=A0A9Q1A0S1_SALPP|nr:hypothetical protein OIU79_026537 [Salix purpurea]
MLIKKTCFKLILVRRSCWASRTGGLLVDTSLTVVPSTLSFLLSFNPLEATRNDAYRAMHKKRKAIPPIGHAVPNVEPQRTEQQGRDPADMEMEDPIESTGRGAEPWKLEFLKSKGQMFQME